MQSVLGDDLILVLPVGAPGLNRFDIQHFLVPGSPWQAHRSELEAEIVATMKAVVRDVTESLGKDCAAWRWSDLHQISFRHSLAKHPTWSHMRVGPDLIGGSPTTLGMAMHMGPGPGGAEPDEIPCRVYHGPAFRLVVDLADPDHAQFVIAGGNGGRPDSPFISDHYSSWLNGRYYRLSLLADEFEASATWNVASK